MDRHLATAQHLCIASHGKNAHINYTFINW